MQYQLGDTDNVSLLAQMLLYSTCKKIKKIIINDNNIRDDMNIISKKQECSRKTPISALLAMPKPLTVWITINWKILKGMGIPDHLTCLLRNLQAGQEATVRTGHGTTDWFQIERGERQGCVLSPCLFNFYAEYIMTNAGLEEAQAGIKIAGRNINNLRNAVTPPLWQKVKRN